MFSRNVSDKTSGYEQCLVVTCPDKTSGYEQCLVVTCPERTSGYEQHVTTKHCS